MDTIGLKELLVLNILIGVIPFWWIYQKAGFSPWLSLLMLVPGLNVLALYHLAFVRWRAKP